MRLIARLSPWGQIALPASVRKSLGLKLGEILAVRLGEDRVALGPVPVGVYTEERIGEFLEASHATPEEITSFCKGWGLDWVRCRTHRYSHANPRALAVRQGAQPGQGVDKG
ncbi:AbrB/MazE/SpoVT family DNA-binding domain-containing protein [Thermus sp. SYSU G05001]|uniref:AbrB/MazE/SpoVT family DNA-binding domain-containing protein n=1 Tax=Thermus brevis TaxID=2862456 RepID=A0ABS7A1L2_9DEIN|nr:AbrB/MazE/SpoVT family DNA-binding domain-containing protein [Thermus brevis]MBW6396181.1 AbrB/MazE/SpoVT family DNA-binding domain-containing protein [Thermus brevis]